MTPGPYKVSLIKSREWYEERRAADPSAHQRQRVVYREAFATLEDVQDFVAGPLAERLRSTPQEAMDLASAVVQLAGPGTITLPNGDVIEVELLRVRVEADQLDGGFVAEAIDFPGVMSQGETEAEAVASLIDAANAAWNAEHGIGLEARA